MKKIRKNAAGIDIGARQIFIGLENEEVQSFETFTSGIYAARDFLLSKKIQTVAMEATGVYWFVLFEVLEEAGLDVWLVDGRLTKQVPGRKTDVKDCQWIQQLHAYGLLSRCFIPDSQIKELRSYNRMREDHIRSASMHVQHMQKALIEMNIRIKEVMSQIHGVSGLRMIDAILDGERNNERLLELCDSRIINSKSDQVLLALEGTYTNQGIFALKQARVGYQFYQGLIAECDQKIQEILERINDTTDNHQDKPQSENKRRKQIRHHKPNIENLGGHLLKIFAGVDATCLPGITDYTWLQLIAETGRDLTRWETEKHFTSWLGLAPGQNRSGKMNRTRNKKAKPKAGLIFRNIAQSLLESKTIALGAFGRRIRGRKGPSTAIKATARKLAILYWRLMVKGVEYCEKGVLDYEQRIAQQKEIWLKKTATSMGYQLTAVQQN